MAYVVVKFGGTSVADPERIGRAADKVISEIKRGNHVAVVVSAMAGVTNQLIDFCNQVSPNCDLIEKDAVVASGEQVTAGLMAAALIVRGMNARSFQGWQVPILCDDQFGKARVENISPENILSCFRENIIPVISGFQGVTKNDRIITLGRGGSDTSAVAVAAAINAQRCDIYTDVDGVYTTDPRIVPDTKKISQISYEEMLEMASVGAKVLHPRAVELAMTYDVKLQVLSTFEAFIGSDEMGTIISRKGEGMEKPTVTGVAFSRDEAKITVMHVDDVPGVAARVLQPLADAKISIDMIVQNISPDGKSTDMTFTVARSESDTAFQVLRGLDLLKNADIRLDKKVAKLSIVGIGMRSHSSIAQTMFQTLADQNINIQVISTSEIKISVLIDEMSIDKAVQSLHSAFGLA